MKGRNWGKKRLCVATEFGADSVTSLGCYRYEFSFILVTETCTLFFLSKPFLETKDLFQYSNSVYVTESKPAIILGSILDSGFGIRGTGFRIPCQWNLDSGFQSLCRFQSPGFRTPQAKLFQIPKPRFSHIGRHSSTSFLCSRPLLKTLKTI